MLAFDLRDQSCSICRDALEQADCYFKRSYYEPNLQALSKTQRSKILPFGLNCCLETCGSRTLVAKLFLRNPACILRFRATLRTYLRLANVKIMERPFSIEPEQIIHFQTRVWQPEEVVGDDFREINETRVALVRSLRREFGARFKGGLVPTAFARVHYPDALSHVKSSRAALIGVYSRGLHHSLGFKLTEYLASSKCIVAEPLRNSLPVPLVEGTHYRKFTAVEECLALCDQLLANPRAAREMRAANWEYYSRYVRFDQLIPRCLNVCDLTASKSLYQDRRG